MRRWAMVALLAPLLVGAQIQRGLAEAHHNFDAPLTLEAPWQPLPCDLALGSCPAVLDDPLRSSVASAALAAASPLGLLLVDAEPGPEHRGFASDTSRAPPVR